MRYLFIVLIVFSLVTCGRNETSDNTPIETNEDLIAHTLEFKKEIIEVTKGIHVAIGYSLANSILIEGHGGNIIIDTTGSVEKGNEIRELFSKINSNPITAIIYTHNHGDHTFGAKAFYSHDNPEIYSHESTEKYVNRIIGVLRPAISKRSNRMFGSTFPLERIENNGIGHFLEIGRKGNTTGYLPPTKTFKESLEVKIAGIDIKLFHAPGETNDQIFVWIPEKKALFPGDNFYKAFPNLYTIRGTPYRDLVSWVKSIDKMRYLHPEYLIPSHTKPLIGKDLIHTELTNYRDAIQFVHDQTIRMINKGMTPNEISSLLTLPPHLISSPFLKEFYGSPSWSARNVFSGYLGWFDGNPTSLNPLSPETESKKMIELAGGWQSLLHITEEAFLKGELQWTLQLTDYLLEEDSKNEKVLSIREKTLIALGEKQSNPNARYYYLSSAEELKPSFKKLDILSQNSESIRGFPIEAFLESLKVNVVAERVYDKDLYLLLKFKDTSKIYSLILRKGILEIQPFEISGDRIEVETTETIWKEILVGIRSLPVSMASGAVTVKGDKLKVISFFNSFKE